MKGGRVTRWLGGGVAAAIVATSWALAKSPEPLLEGIAYTVTIDGFQRADGALRKAAESSSRCLALRGEPPANLSQLQARADDDAKAIRSLLLARGYLQAAVTAEVDAATLPATVAIRVTRGSLFTFGELTVEVTRTDGSTFRPALPIGYESGRTAEADAILKGTEAILDRLRDRGHPFPRLVTRRLEPDLKRRRLNVFIGVEAGPKAVFGDLNVEGLVDLDESFVRLQTPWKEGDDFRQSDVDEFQRRLSSCGLFATVRIESGGGVDDRGRVPMRVVLLERKPRTIRVSARYNSDTGAGGSASWEHRNLFGGGESLKLEGSASRELYAVTARYRQPSIVLPEVSLASLLGWKKEQTDAYDSESLETEWFVDREFFRDFRAGAGAGYLYSIVTQLDDTERYGFVYVPLRANWDKTDDLLDPSRGWRIKGDCAPYVETLGQDLAFWRNTVEGSYYVRVLKDPRLVFANRLRGGWAVGASRDDLPADLRFYAGGGGSVRGYEYQSIGDQQDGTPLGGSSLLETSFELRMQATETLGVVAFADGGSAYEEAVPGSDSTFRWGAGVGVRYYSAIGPFRIDVATPINKRDEDESFQIYISLGQAF